MTDQFLSGFFFSIVESYRYVESRQSAETLRYFRVSRMIYDGLHRWARNRRRSKKKNSSGRSAIGIAMFTQTGAITLKFAFVSLSRTFTRVSFIKARLLK